MGFEHLCNVVGMLWAGPQAVGMASLEPSTLSPGPLVTRSEPERQILGPKISLGSRRVYPTKRLWWDSVLIGHLGNPEC